MYHYYKPLRNFASKLNLQKSLVQICQFCQNINYGKAIPLSFSRLNIQGNASVKNVIYPWELDILVREIILNAGSKSEKDLMSVQDFGIALRLIKGISEKQEVLIKGDNVLHEMHRIVHTQFPWQKGSDFQKLGRYLKIYSFPALSDALVEQTNLNVEQYFLMGLSAMGHFIKEMHMSPFLQYDELGISKQQRDQFWSMIASDIPALKAKTEEMQQYNENWSYTLNPLRRTPLIYLDHDIPVFVCPIPEFLLNRVTDGIYYDLKGDFSGAYGDAFEAYVGEVSVVLCDEAIEVKKPKPYKISKALKDGVDWIIEDSEAALLVECKTKGLNLKAKSDFNIEELHSEISKMAKMVVQNYKNLFDIINGDTLWCTNGKSIFPIIVSLHDWLLFGPTLNKFLEELVDQGLETAGLSLNLVVEHPFSIMSVEDYETMLQVVNQTGIRKLFEHKQSLDHRRWLMGAFINTHYHDEMLKGKNDYWLAELDRLHEKWMA